MASTKGTSHVTRLFMPVIIFVGVLVFGLKATESGNRMPQTSPFSEIIKSNDLYCHRTHAPRSQNAVTWERTFCISLFRVPDKPELQWKCIEFSHSLLYSTARLIFLKCKSYHATPSPHLKNFWGLLIISRRKWNFFSLAHWAHQGLAPTFFWSFISSCISEFQPPMEFPGWIAAFRLLPQARAHHFSIPSCLPGWCRSGFKMALMSPHLERTLLFGESFPLRFLGTFVIPLPASLLCCMAQVD